MAGHYEDECKHTTFYGSVFSCQYLSYNVPINQIYIITHVYLQTAFKKVVKNTVFHDWTMVGFFKANVSLLTMKSMILFMTFFYTNIFFFNSIYTSAVAILYYYL